MSESELSQFVEGSTLCPYTADLPMMNPQQGGPSPFNTPAVRSLPSVCCLSPFLLSQGFVSSSSLPPPPSSSFPSSSALLPSYTNHQGQDEEDDGPPREVYIGNLQPRLPDDVLLEALSRIAGERVQHLRRIAEKKCGFVTFSTHEVAKRVVEKYGGRRGEEDEALVLGGDEIRINWSHNKKHKRGREEGYDNNNSDSGVSKRQRLYPSIDTQERRENCWFCLSSPHCETHLIVSIGQEHYLANPKGPIYSGHLMLIPIAHVPSTLALTGEESVKEREAYLVDLMRFYASSTYQEDMPTGLTWVGCVLIERYLPSSRSGLGHHTFLEVVPLLVSIEEKEGAMERIMGRFQDKTREDGFLFRKGVIPEEVEEERKEDDDDDCRFVHFRFYSSSSDLSVDSTHFTLDLNNKEEEEKKNTTTGAMTPYYPREVICELLDLPSRKRWKECALGSKEEEEASTRLLREGFQPFDHTMA